MEKLKEIDYKIVKTMLEKREPLTTREIANMSKISWNTAFDHLKDMHKKGWIRQIRRGRRIYWVESGKIL